MSECRSSFLLSLSFEQFTQKRESASHIILLYCFVWVASVFKKNNDKKFFWCMPFRSKTKHRTRFEYNIQFVCQNRPDLMWIYVNLNASLHQSLPNCFQVSWGMKWWQMNLSDSFTYVLVVIWFQLTRENKDLKERCTTLEEELRICNKQLDRGNASIQRLERDLDEVHVQSFFEDYWPFILYTSH